jgi:Glycine/D-amino acid oxidases (deaminating)
MAQRVAVIGAGVVGLACAAQLQMRGHAVSIVDPRFPGEYCSFGNAGCFSRASFVPLGVPGMWKKVPGWLLDPNGPLSIPLAYAPRAAPWVWRLLRASTIENVTAIADAMRPLMDASIDKWRPLARWAGVPELIQQRGYAWAYESEAGFAGDAFGRGLREERGVKLEILRGPAIRELEPALSPKVTHLVVMPQQGHCPNPLRLSQALAERLREGGARFVTHEAVDFRVRDGRVTHVVNRDGEVEADAVVIAAGAHSAKLTAKLGTKVPLESERGYHVMLHSPSGSRACRSCRARANSSRPRWKAGFAWRAPWSWPDWPRRRTTLAPMPLPVACCASSPISRSARWTAGWVIVRRCPIPSP